MSTVLHKKIRTKSFKDYPVNIEVFDSAMEVANSCKTRTITNTRFEDMQHEDLRKSWHAVKSYDEAIGLLNNGYEAVVEKLKAGAKLSAQSVQKRITFENEIQGFAPIVPLAILGVPNNMINMTMKPMKRKVMNVYYDITASSGTDKDDIINASAKLTGIIMELEARGYRFNLYAVQSYTNDDDADMLVVKLKSSDKPIDLRRMSFPLCHPAFFRVIGFDWYSKFPQGKYRSTYGRAMKYTFKSDYAEAGKQLFGDDSILFSAVNLINQDIEQIKEELTCNT